MKHAWLPAVTFAGCALLLHAAAFADPVKSVNPLPGFVPAIESSWPATDDAATDEETDTTDDTGGEGEASEIPASGGASPRQEILPREPVQNRESLQPRQ
ncbi:MAG: hypothetical protein AB7P76_06845 [Candidatus Melainabacteria bacterium]